MYIADEDVENKKKEIKETRIPYCTVRILSTELSTKSSTMPAYPNKPLSAQLYWFIVSLLRPQFAGTIEFHVNRGYRFFSSKTTIRRPKTIEFYRFWKKLL